MEKGVPIRALSRGIAVLQAINRGGALSMMEIARTSGVPYPTACRIVQTLLHEGLVDREPTRKRYRPTMLVQTLSHGFQGDGGIVEIARPHLVSLTRDVNWPISLATHVGHSMVIRDSTHSLTSLTFNHYFPGFAMPMLRCASGIVHLSHLPAGERAGLLDAAKLLPNEATLQVIELFEKERLAEKVAAQGYATRARNTFTRNPGKTSSIAVAIRHDGRSIAAVTLAFFASAMRMEEAIARFVGPLRKTADAIGAEIGKSPETAE